MDTVFATAGGAEASMGAYGALVRPGNFTGPKAGLANTTVLARYGSDQTAAATIRAVGGGRASRRRDCHSAAPLSPFSRRCNRDGEGVPAP